MSSNRYSLDGWKERTNGYPLSHFVNTNRRLFKFINLTTSLEFVNQRFFFKNQGYSYMLGRIRLIFLLHTLVRGVIICFFDKCEYNELRYTFYDWTVVYPTSYRGRLRRFLISVPFIVIFLRRMVLYKGYQEAPFHDFLISHPGLNIHRYKSSGQSESPRNARYSTEDLDYFKKIKVKLGKRNIDRYDHRTGSLRVIDSLDGSTMNQFGFNPKLVASNDNDDHFSSGVNWINERSLEHWIHLSLYVENFICRLIKFFSLFAWLLVFGAVLRVVYILDGQRECDLVDTRLRIVGGFELAFVFCEFVFSVMGVMTYIVLVHKDLIYLSHRSKKNLKCIVEPRGPLDDEHNQISRLSNTLVERLNHLDKLNLREIRESATSSGSNASIIGDIRTKNEDYLILWQTTSAQISVVQFLSAFDGHKKNITLIGNFCYLWALLSLSLAPLVVQRDGSVAYYGYAVLLSISMTCCLVFSLLCGHVNQQSTIVGKLVFKACNKIEDKDRRRRWNKILLLWFNPNRCSFRVANTLDLTYINLIKSISFILSGLALILNYSHE